MKRLVNLQLTAGRGQRERGCACVLVASATPTPTSPWHGGARALQPASSSVEGKDTVRESSI